MSCYNVICIFTISGFNLDLVKTYKNDLIFRFTQLPLDERFSEPTIIQNVPHPFMYLVIVILNPNQSEITIFFRNI